MDKKNFKGWLLIPLRKPYCKIKIREQFFETSNLKKVKKKKIGLTKN